MAKEIVNTYLLKNPAALIPEGREAFYRDQVSVFNKTGKPTRSVETVHVFIFNKIGEFFLQKRSYRKAHNPGLLDKSIGGHVRYGDTPDYTVMVETLQELQTPSIVLEDREDFRKTFTLLKNYLTTIAIVEHIDHTNYISEKVIKGRKIKIANRLHTYLGVYNGRVRPVDREAQGILWYSLKDLDREMKKSPRTFTYDMHFFLKHYKSEIKSFIKDIVKK